MNGCVWHRRSYVFCMEGVVWPTLSEKEVPRLMSAAGCVGSTGLLTSLRSVSTCVRPAGASGHCSCTHSSSQAAKKAACAATLSSCRVVSSQHQPQQKHDQAPASGWHKRNCRWPPGHAAATAAGLWECSSCTVPACSSSRWKRACAVVSPAARPGSAEGGCSCSALQGNGCHHDTRAAGG